MLIIRPFDDADSPHLVRILIANAQFGDPDVEGDAAMRRVARCEAAVFLVAEDAGEIAGLVRGVYDGSRAMIHLLSVAPARQRRGVGRALVEAAVAEFLRRGAPTVSVTTTAASQPFWRQLGFDLLPVTLMLNRTPARLQSDSN